METRGGLELRMAYKPTVVMRAAAAATVAVVAKVATACSSAGKLGAAAVAATAAAAAAAATANSRKQPQKHEKVATRHNPQGRGVKDGDGRPMKEV